MKNSLFSIFLVILFLPSCKMAEIIVHEDLANTTNQYEVKGKRKIRWKSKVAFGDYVVRETKKSFPSSSKTSISVFGKKKGKQKLRLEMVNTSKKENSFEIAATNSFKNFNVDLFPNGDEIQFNTNDNFSGSFISEATGKEWVFYISNYSRSSFLSAYGYLSDGETLINIEEIEEIGKGMMPSDDQVFGFSFEENGIQIGAVRTYGKGKVWIEDNIIAEKKDVLAAISGTLLLTKNVDTL